MIYIKEKNYQYQVFRLIIYLHMNDWKNESEIKKSIIGKEPSALKVKIK